jgi:hypothetical protein|eukprot:2753043-Prymnesium_polylepis.1
MSMQDRINATMARIDTTRASARALGLEYEIGWQWNSADTAQRLKDASGVEVLDAGYTHGRTDVWKVVFDRSLVFQWGGYTGHELVSPKLEGRDALVKVGRMVAAIENMGRDVDVNKTCGHHVHFNASDLTAVHVGKISAAFYVYEEAFDLLMPPSRQANRNKQFLRSHRATCNGDEASVIRRIKAATSIDDVIDVICPDVPNDREYKGKRYYKLNLTNASTRYRAPGRNFWTM